MSTSRKRRGRETELIVCDWFQLKGWPFAQTVASAAPGRDLTGMPGLAPEIKARREFHPTAWARQAERNSKGDLPFVVMRPDGMGAKTIHLWPAFLPLQELTRLLRMADYGGEADVQRALASIHQGE